MKISMIPNKIVKLIHASKGDTSLRKWAFEPYDNNGAINVSNIKDQLVYKTENGGTEQLLPVNTSTPTTSYFDGTINYGTDTDVEFTYKQSSYTGQARVKSIKGNTLVWNQLVDSGTSSVTLTSGHVYITKVGTTWSRVSGTGGSISVTGGSDCVFDLTKMFDSGNEPTLDEFRSLFPLNYYAYNSGSLLNFNGEGLKATGKNLCTRTTDSNIYNAGNLIPIRKGQTIYWGGVWTGGSMWAGIYESKDAVNKNTWIQQSTFKGGGEIGRLTANYDGYFGICFNSGVATYNVEKMMISFVSFTIDEIVDYTESTLSLPISTYFPTGMKDIDNGRVYDELNDKAITRIGSIVVDGSQAYPYSASESGNWTTINLSPNGGKIDNDNVQLKCSDKFTPISFNKRANQSFVSVFRCYLNDGGHLVLRLPAGDTTFTSSAEAKTYFTSNPVTINYELATYTEQDIKNASLVCKNIEVPCYLSSGNLVCDATEELTSEAGFFDAKLKLKDSSSVAYSSKFKLHVEDL